ncbi:unnamed protein product, partial [marine sediment metagenome]
MLKVIAGAILLFKPPCLFGHEWAGDVVEVGDIYR